MITTAHGREVLTCTGRWPVKSFEAAGETLQLPQILVR